MVFVWLPKRYAETELRMEKTGERTFSRVLTREEVSDLRLRVRAARGGCVLRLRELRVSLPGG